MSRASRRSRPPASATFISPRNRVITPTRPMARVTAPEAASMMAADSSSMGAVPPAAGSQTSWCQPANTKARLTMTSRMVFMRFPG